MPLKNQDITFRKSRTGAPITAKNGEYVCNVAKNVIYDETWI